MQFIKSSDKSWDEKKGYSKKVYLSEDELKTKGAHVQEIKIKPREVAKNHYHKVQTEIFYFLNNNGYFVVNGEKISVKTGDIIVIEPNDMHEVVNNSDDDFLYMAFKLNYNEQDSYWE